MNKLFDRESNPYRNWELLFMRAGFACVLYLCLPAQMTLEGQPHPAGLGHFIDFTFLSIPGVWTSSLILTVIALVCYVLGVLSVPSLTWMAFITIATGTLQNSQGAIHHIHQPVALIVLAQWATAVTGLFSRPGGLGRFWKEDLPGQRHLALAAVVMLVSCYASSAITKIERSKGQWMWRTPDLAVQVVKTNYDAYYTTGEKPGTLSESAPRWMAEHPHLTRLIIGPALLLELLAFLALLGRGPALAVGSALIAMHEGIDGLMRLDFWLWELLLFVFLVNSPYWIALLFRRFRIPTMKKLPADLAI